MTEPVPLHPRIAVPQRPAPLNWRALADISLPRRDWIIPGWLPPGVALFAGAGGVGKSLVAQEIATRVCMGMDVLGVRPREANVLIWACEDSPEEIWRRQLAICASINVPLADLDGRLFIVPRAEVDSTILKDQRGHTSRSVGVLAQLVKDISEAGAELVVLDNVAHLFGADENSRADVTAFLRTLGGLCDHRTSILLLHHVAKAAGSEFAGSGAWENVGRSRWFLSTQRPDDPEAGRDPDVRYLSLRKSNYGAKTYRTLRWVDGIFDDQTPVPTNGPPGVVDHLYAERAKRIVLAGLRKLRAMGETPTSSPQAVASYLPRMMIDHEVHEGESKASLEGAMRALMKDGVLMKAPVGKYAKGGERLGLVEVEAQKHDDALPKVLPKVPQSSQSPPS